MAKILVLCLVVVLGSVALVYAPEGNLGGTWLARATAAVGFDSDTPGEPAYRHAVVERGDLLSSVAATGALAAVATVLVGSEVSGQVKEIYSDFNSEVRRGDAVALIDPIIFEIAVEQAQADLDIARAQVATQRSTIERLTAAADTARFDHQSAHANAETAGIVAEEAAAELRRRQALAANGSAADRERAGSAHQAALAQLRSTEALEAAKRSLVDAAQADLRAAVSQMLTLQAVVRLKEAALRQAQTELERTVIRAPVDGVVIQRTVEAGQTVAASLEAPTLFTIAQDLRDMQVNASIDESEIGRIVPGQTVEFTVDAYPGRRFTGTVSQIRKFPETVQNVVTYTVVVKAPNPDLLLLPGMTASARFIIAESKDVLKVPNAALRFKPADMVASPGPDQIWVERAGTLRPIPVQVGLTDGAHMEISGEGLEEGMQIVIGVESVKQSPSVAKRLIGVF